MKLSAISGKREKLWRWFAKPEGSCHSSWCTKRAFHSSLKIFTNFHSALSDIQFTICNK